MTVVVNKPRVGIVSDSRAQRDVLEQMLSSHGYFVRYKWAPDHLSMQSAAERSQLIDSIDICLVEIEDEDQWGEAVDDLLEQLLVPVLFGEGKPPSVQSRQYPRWQRRVIAKVRELVGEPSSAAIDEVHLQELAQVPPLRDGEVHDDSLAAMPVTDIGKHPLYESSESSLAEIVWVLGASLGGPEAVKKFLDTLSVMMPKSQPISVAFLLAQHIDDSFLGLLSRVLGRHNRFDVRLAKSGESLLAGQVVLVPVKHQMKINPQGHIEFSDEAWPGLYAPSIDAVMAQTASQYGEKSGAIVFSGMGNDGAVAVPKVVAEGAQVWAQSAESCANSSQPDAVVETGGVTFVGSPEELAEQFNQYLQRQRVSATVA